MLAPRSFAIHLVVMPAMAIQVPVHFSHAVTNPSSGLRAAKHPACADPPITTLPPRTPSLDALASLESRDLLCTATPPLSGALTLSLCFSSTSGWAAVQRFESSEAHCTAWTLRSRGLLLLLLAAVAAAAPAQQPLFKQLVGLALLPLRVLFLRPLLVGRIIVQSGAADHYTPPLELVCPQVVLLSPHH